MMLHSYKRQSQNMHTSLSQHIPAFIHLAKPNVFGSCWDYMLSMLKSKFSEHDQSCTCLKPLASFKYAPT